MPDWHDDPRLAFQLGEGELGQSFGLDLSGNGVWTPVDEFEYLASGQSLEPEWPEGRPRRIRLRRADDSVFASGHFV